jgi:hypothetical protein
VLKVDLRKEASNMLYQFLREYKKQRIYFSDDLCKRLQEFSDLLYKITIPLSIALTAKNEGEANKFYDVLLKSHEDFNNQVPVARKTIQDEFRSLLGVAEIETLQTNQKPSL